MSVGGFGWFACGIAMPGERLAGKQAAAIPLDRRSDQRSGLEAARRACGHRRLGSAVFRIFRGSATVSGERLAGQDKGKWSRLRAGCGSGLARATVKSERIQISLQNTCRLRGLAPA